ncbi:MAG: YdcF family protein [Candidatus Sulfopaludibacter sp.]|nr:YdcF family protein [Candidatus Sulfopaludibacter sp.]
MTYLQPALPLALALLAAGLMAHRNRTWWRIALVAWAGLFLWSWAPFAWLTSGTLEWFYPVAAFPAGGAEAIVVLSANVVPPNASQPEPEAGFSTYLRCRHAAWLYHHWHAVPIVASGGKTEEGIVISRIMRHVLESEGVPPDQVWTEENSTSTYENVRNTAAILRLHGIRRAALVTEAYHMLRAEKSFRKQGVTVVPAPFGYRTLETSWNWRAFIPGARPQLVNGDNLHEWIGLLWYWLSGKI